MIANWDLFSAYYSMLVHRFSHSCSLMQQIVSYFGCATRHVGSQSPDQGSNPCPLHWKHGGVLTTGPGGMSQ